MGSRPQACTLGLSWLFSLGSSVVQESGDYSAKKMDAAHGTVQREKEGFSGILLRRSARLPCAGRVEPLPPRHRILTQRLTRNVAKRLKHPGSRLRLQPVVVRVIEQLRHGREALL